MANNYIDSQLLRTRLYQEYYLGENMTTRLDFMINNDENTVNNLKKILQKT